MRHCQDLKTNIYDAECLGICLNSRVKLDTLDEEEIAKYMIYIENVSSFAEFTDNNLLGNKLKNIVSIRTCLMKYARNVIVSNAFINDATFEL